MSGARAAPLGPSGQDLSWPCRHPGRAGTFDETARRASHQELAVAKTLVSEGHEVRTVAERKGARTPDLEACGASVEVKSFQGLAERGGRAPRAESVANKLLDARGQGSIAVILATGSGLSATAARAGYDMFRDRAVTEGLGKVRGVRVMGDGFDVSFKAAVDVRLAGRSVEAGARPGGARPQPPTIS
jgi:hypothetical protein